MEQQLSFFASEDSPRQVNSLFLAFIPGESTTGDIAKSRALFEQQNGPLGKLVQPEQFHMTLVFIDEYHGEIPESVIGAVSKACMAASQVSPFPIVFNHLESFSNRPGNLPLVMTGDENPQLNAFQISLLRQLALQGLPCKKNPKFNPHLTLSRGPKAIPRQPIEPISWSAGEIVLVQSVIGQGRHIHLGRWSLSAVG